MEIARLPGFREFYPEDLALRSYIFQVWREVARRYGFVEYDGPPLEPLELYTSKSGPEIVGQLYGFTDRGEREVALRPEMTPTFARMVSARAAALPKPIKWFSIPQLFRYERPQRGRLREHFQLNLDVVGEPDGAVDAELVAAAVDVLRAFGLGPQDFVARVSDRRLIGAVLGALGIPQERRPSAFAALDRAEGDGEERVVAALGEAGASPEAARRILALGGMSLDAIADEFGSAHGVEEAAERLAGFFGALNDFGLRAFVTFDATLVRGLAYYTGCVFELWERSGEFRAICGGGRYDNLLASLGGVDLPALGFGMGDVVLGELLKDRGLIPGGEAAIDDFVISVSEGERPLALRLVHALREQGRRAAFDYRGRAVGRQFRAADQAGARRAIIVGPDEAARQVALVREMATGEERAVPLSELLGDGRWRRDAHGEVR
ncbi:MAG: histidine--tRNA ligase [Gemmatimonadota bacterium]